MTSAVDTQAIRKLTMVTTYDSGSFGWNFIELPQSVPSAEISRKAAEAQIDLYSQANSEFQGVLYLEGRNAVTGESLLEFFPSESYHVAATLMADFPHWKALGDKFMFLSYAELSGEPCADIPNFCETGLSSHELAELIEKHAETLNFEFVALTSADAMALYAVAYCLRRFTEE